MDNVRPVPAHQALYRSYDAKMVGINAAAVLAQLLDEKACGDRSAEMGVGEAMRAV
jgi:hypothetical protein